jgi:hypothetical protein
LEHGNSIKIGCEGIFVLWLAAVEACALAAVQRCVAGLLNGLCSKSFVFFPLLSASTTENTGQYRVSAGRVVVAVGAVARLSKWWFHSRSSFTHIRLPSPG